MSALLLAVQAVPVVEDEIIVLAKQLESEGYVGIAA